MAVHLMKLVVGIDSLADYAKWQSHEVVPFQGGKANIVYTRFKPKRAEEILETGGSIYRVIKGQMCCRQKIIGFELIPDEDTGGTRCLIFTDRTLVQTQAIPHRPFQGWRYVPQGKIPTDIGPYVMGAEQAEPDLDMQLKAAGLL